MYDRPLLIDLYCGIGGSSMGYYRAGYDVIGVDIATQNQYPFPFFRADALEFLSKLGNKLEIQGRRIDAIHASPPCQKFVSLGKALGNWKGFNHFGDLLTPTRSRFLELEIPWVIENVPGAPLHRPITLCGSMFDLKIERGELGLENGGYLQRHRLFESNLADICGIPLMVPGPCSHGLGEGLPAIGVYGNGRGGGQLMARTANADQARKLMGIDWAGRNGITQAVPPAYTEYIGRQLISVV